MKCPRCEYVWDPKVPNPKECPRCKVRLDYVPGPVGAPKLKIEREVKKGMSSKLPWIAATVIIVVAAGLGAWALATPATPPSSVGGTATITGVAGGGQFALGLIENAGGDYPAGIGIENIYIIDHDKGDNTKNFANQGADNWIVPSDNDKSIIYCSGDTASIPYENDFDIVVAVRIQAENVAYLTKDNLQNSLAFTYDGTEWKDNSDVLDTDGMADEFVFENNFPDKYPSSTNPTGYLRMNHRCDNNGHGFVLKAGASITIQDNFYAWK